MHRTQILKYTQINHPLPRFVHESVVYTNFFVERCGKKIKRQMVGQGKILFKTWQLVGANLLTVIAKWTKHINSQYIVEKMQVSIKQEKRSPAHVGCMRQVLRAGALGRPRGMGWGGMWEGGSGWGIHVNPWLIHVNVWQKPLQYCKVISLQLIKINGKEEKK